MSPVQQRQEVVVQRRQHKSLVPKVEGPGLAFVAGKLHHASSRFVQPQRLRGGFRQHRIKPITRLPLQDQHPHQIVDEVGRLALGVRPASTSRACTASTSSCRDEVHGQRSLRTSSAALMPGSLVNRVAPSACWYSWRELSRRLGSSAGGTHAAMCKCRNRLRSGLKRICGSRSAWTSSDSRNMRLTTKSMYCSTSTWTPPHFSSKCSSTLGP